MSQADVPQAYVYDALRTPRGKGKKNGSKWHGFGQLIDALTLDRGEADAFRIDHLASPRLSAALPAATKSSF